jgi:hypothetical protein
MALDRETERRVLLPSYRKFSQFLEQNVPTGSVLTKPRYEARPLPEGLVGHWTHTIFDTFQQEFVYQERHTEAQAERAAERYNQRYEEFMRR